MVSAHGRASVSPENCSIAQVVAIIRHLSRSPAERDSGTSRFQLPNRQTRRRLSRGIDMATCPECDAEIEVDEFDVDKGDQLSCPECGSSLEVTGVSPIQLDLAPDDDDDDDDDDLDDDEEGDEDEDEDEE